MEGRMVGASDWGPGISFVGVRGFDSHCAAYGSLAQWIECPVTSREVACLSHARSAGGMV